MGGMIEDSSTTHVLHQLNTRFGAGDPITEMAALHKQFQVFSPTNHLKHTYALLNIAPTDPRERQRWFAFLDHLKTYPSDMPGVNGHDRVVKAYQDNLESAKPLPVYTTVHAAKDDPKVLVTTDRPVVFIPEDHIVISIPTMPAGQARAAAARIARDRRPTRRTAPSKK